MTNDHPAAATAESGEIDVSARCTLSFLIATGLVWLVVSGALALLNLAQSFTPALLAHCPVFTYGRVHAMQETAFIYGWAASSGMAVALWLLARLGGTPLRSLQWTRVGAIFWHLGVLLSLVGIAFGEGHSIAWLRMPFYLQPLLLVAFAAMAVPGVLAWSDRREPVTFAAQWYAFAALFLFPWLFSAAQATLVWLPVRGALQAVAAGWFVQGAWTLWLAPLALAAAYYLIPKITGRAIPNYDFASLGFWTLVSIGGWTAARRLVGGPVPAWLITVGITACALLLIHYVIVAVNLRGAFRQSSLALAYVAFGLGAYLLGGLVDAAASMRNVAELLQFTWFDQAQTQLALNGAFTMIIFGAIYFLAPRLAGQPWPSLPLLRAHYSAAVLGTVILVAALAAAGWTQGRDLAHATTTFADIAAHTRPWLQTAAAAQALLVIGNALFALHFVRLAVAKPAASPIRQPPAMEASAS